jgi:predicted membrane-bound spermidine synthase
MDVRAPGPMLGSSASRTYLLNLSLLAVSFMLFQVALLRELRFQLTTLFTLTPFLFSSVILWIALGSLAASRIRSGVRDVLRRCLLVLPLLAIPLFAASIGIAHRLITDGDVVENMRFQSSGVISQSAQDLYFQSTIVAFVAVAVFGYGLLFFLQGLLFALYFRDAREEGVLSEVYAADLFASGLGAVLGGVFGFWLTPVQLVLGSTVLFLATVWSATRPLQIGWVKTGAVTALALLLVLGGEVLTGALTRLEQPRWLYVVKHSLWSRYRHIDAREHGPILEIFTDGMFFQGYNRQDTLHQADPRSLPAREIARMNPPASQVLVIGGGSGADVRILRTLVGEKLGITAVELDQGFVSMAQQFPWLWGPYSTARIVVQEGRYFLENSRDTYDAVIFAYVDPQSAIGSIGIPDANFLYTDAGIRAAYARVRPGGFLFINRMFLDREEGSFVERLCATLAAAGIPRSEIALYRGAGSGANQYFGQVTSMHVLVRKGGVPPEVDWGKSPLAWVDGGRATTDLFPFSLGTGIWFDTLMGYVRRNPLPLSLGAVAAGLIVLSIATNLGRSVFFTLGFGSFLLESLVLFNSFLLFGDPNFGAALAVGAFLIWNGVGSLISARFENRRGFYAAVPVLLLLYAVTAPFLNGATLAFSAGIRIAVFTAHLSLAGIAAGMMFPIALRKFKEASVPWMFFMDVVGCAVAPPVFWLALSTTGVWLVMAGSALCYALVCGVLALRR